MSDNDKTKTGPAASTAPTRTREGSASDREGDTSTRGGSDEQVHDKGTTAVPAEKVANAAAETLHGARAVEEKYAQPDAKALVGGATLISDPKGANPAAGERA